MKGKPIQFLGWKLPTWINNECGNIHFFFSYSSWVCEIRAGNVRTTFVFLYMWSPYPDTTKYDEIGPPQTIQVTFLWQKQTQLREKRFKKMTCPIEKIPDKQQNHYIAKAARPKEIHQVCMETTASPSIKHISKVNTVLGGNIGRNGRVMKWTSNSGRANPNESRISRSKTRKS